MRAPVADGYTATPCRSLVVLPRPLLAAMFVSGGIDALQHPDQKVPRAAPVTDKIAETVPPRPATPATLVRVNGAVMVVGGVLLATGRLPRLASVALAASLIPTTFAGPSLLGDRGSAAARATTHPLPEERVDARRPDHRRHRHRGPPVVVLAGEEAGAPDPRRPADRRLNLRGTGRRAGHALDCGHDPVHLGRLARHRTTGHLRRPHRPGFRDRAPRLHHHDTLGDVMLIDNGQSLVPYWLVAAAGRPTEEVRARERQDVRRAAPGRLGSGGPARAIRIATV